MVTEQGIIINATPSQVWIKTHRSTSCKNCEAKDTCNEKNNFKEIIVQVENTLNASTGDSVILGFKTGPLLKLTFMLYIFPIIFLIVGAGIGQAIAPFLQIDQSLTSLLLGFVCFTLSFIIIKKMNNKLAVKKEYKPFLVKISN